MAGKRVFEVAKELKIPTKQLMEELHGMGLDVSSNFSAVDESVVAKLKKAHAAKKAAPKKAEEKPAKKAAAKTPEKAAAKPAAKPAAPGAGAKTVEARPKPTAARKAAPSRTGEEAREKDAGAGAGAQATAGVKSPGVKEEKPAAKPAEKEAKPERAAAEAKPAEKAKAGSEGVATATRAAGPTARPAARPPVERGGAGAGTAAPPTREATPPPATPAREATPPPAPPKARKLRLPSGITVRDFAQKVGKTPAEIIRALMNMGEMANINQPMSDEAVHLIGEDLGFEVEVKSRFIEEEEEEFEDRPEDLKPRPPVVTVMGHVDHGKTSLLDAIRSTDVISTEFGGITQHIGAYQVKHEGRTITFIDTPGHESFTALRARGAQVTDIAVLVVAADDGVMPQTVEAIDHARAAGVPMVVAVNKIDKEEANPLRVRQELTEHNLVPEEWGGDTIFVDVSAKQKQNLDKLMESILLLADLYEYKARYDAPARGTVIEARLDKGRGPIATVLVQRGTLRVGDPVVAGAHYGRVRALLDDRGNRVDAATPSMPVEVLGIGSVPDPGDELRAVEDERRAKALASERQLKERIRSEQQETPRHISLEDLFDRIKQGDVQELNIIVKGDVQGSVEALCDAVAKIEQEEVRVRVIHRGVGGVTENDVMLASASGAIIIGFNVRPDAKAKELAEKEKVDLRTYRVIYQVIEDLEAARTGMLAPEFEEVQTGYAQVQATFRVPKAGTVGGAFLREGEINRNSNVRLVRDGAIVFEGKLSSLKRFKDDVRSVSAGYEFGFGLEGFQDLKEGDILEAYEIREKPRTETS
jgi:translation initiation factor IF-2